MKPFLHLRNIKLVLEYDGTGYYGFQRQPGRPTVQASLEEALTKLFHRRMKIKSASSRTDAGVHALGQVIHFMTASGMPLLRMRLGLNHYLPPDIAVREIEEASSGFHARFDAKTKIYRYLIWNHASRSPLRAAYVYHRYGKLDLKEMRQAARFLEGRHDFRSFCGAGARKKKKRSAEGGQNTVRTVHSFRISKKGDLIRFTVEADGFLNHMVRNFAGSLLEVGAGKITSQEMAAILKSRDRRKAGMAAPARGLCLVSVTY